MAEHVYVQALVCMALTILCTGGTPVHRERGMRCTTYPPGPFTGPTLVKFTTEMNYGDKNITRPTMNLTVCGHSYPGTVEHAEPGHFSLSVRLPLTETCNGSSVICEHSYTRKGWTTVEAESLPPIIFLAPPGMTTSSTTLAIVLPLAALTCLVAGLYFCCKKRTLPSPRTLWLRKTPPTSLDNPGDSATSPCNIPLTSLESPEILS